MSFDFQPTLRGDLVTLRPLRPDDWDELFAVASDPFIWEQHPARDRHKEDVFRRFFREALDETKAHGGAFAVIDNATGKIIGSTRFHATEAQPREVEIGWTFLARSHWGGRFNHEMKRLMLEHAFQHVERVIFLVGESNIRSQTAVQRIGGVRDGFVDKVDFSGTTARSVKFVINKPR
jgi:RimJ/RimL family protein N-acetyltransferase